MLLSCTSEHSMDSLKALLESTKIGIGNMELPSCTQLSAAAEEYYSAKLKNLLEVRKRKSTLELEDLCLPEKRMRTECSSNLMPAPTSSLCEIRTQLSAAKVQIAWLETQIVQHRKKQTEREKAIAEERRDLNEQHMRDKRARSDLEVRFQRILARENQLKEDYNEILIKHKQYKAKSDTEKIAYEKQIVELKNKVLESDVSSKDQLSEMKKDINELFLALQDAQSEVTILRNEVSKQTSKAEQCGTIRSQLEKQTFELQLLTNKLKQLECERDMSQDWQQQAKTAQNRLINMAELEKEQARLRAQELSLQNTLCCKLLLEERVELLQSRVDVLQPIQNELHEVKIQLTSLESSLEEWKTAARSVGINDAWALPSALNTALNSQLDATTVSANVPSQLAQLTEEITTVKYKRDKAVRNLNDLVLVSENQESIIERLQQRLRLATKESESYRQQLNCYEKELTAAQYNEVGVGGAALLSVRIEQLEKSLEGYRELLATQDLAEHTQLVEKLRGDSRKWREESERLGQIASKLRAERDALLSQIETISLESRIMETSTSPSTE